MSFRLFPLNEVDTALAIDIIDIIFIIQKSFMQQPVNISLEVLIGIQNLLVLKC